MLKQVNKKSILMLLFFVVGLVGLSYGQTFSNATSTAAGAVQTEFNGVKNIVKWMSFIFMAGGFGYLIFILLFRPEQSASRMAGMIGALVAGAIGVVLQFVA